MMPQFKFFRALIWVIWMMLCAHLLGIEWSWRIIILCMLSSLADAVIYADYSDIGKIERRS
jgi:hypothetical protein